ncbi:hypothetical protein PG996_011823 [Apiospora saccharicola]|uniref:Uncharacterized protein n=1 Tax=Apiospora saccharicola TaxID=335842 RepID=A0ABR1UG58_9PEZI
MLQGTLSLMTPGDAPYTIHDGKASYGEPVQTECRPGEVVLQRGMMHASPTNGRRFIMISLSNRTSSWVRLLGIVLDAKPNRVPSVEASEEEGSSKPLSFKVLEDQWLA